MRHTLDSGKSIAILSLCITPDFSGYIQNHSKIEQNGTHK